MTRQEKGRGKCVRCGRRLSDPVSVRRGMGPVCWGASRGDVFEHDLEATDEEWGRREKLLRGGGEIDFGCNWRHIDYDPEMALQIPSTMRVSLRYRGGQFEVYGMVYDPRGNREIVFGGSADIRAAYEIAVAAGPQCEAQVYRMQRSRARRARRAA